MNDDPRGTPDFDNKIYRVLHHQVIGNQRFLVYNDVIFPPGAPNPMLVLEWKEVGDRIVPDLWCWLDPARLSEGEGPGYYVYNGDIEDPRTVQ